MVGCAARSKDGTRGLKPSDSRRLDSSRRSRAARTRAIAGPTERREGRLQASETTTGRPLLAASAMTPTSTSMSAFSRGRTRTWTRIRLVPSPCSSSASNKRCRSITKCRNIWPCSRLELTLRRSAPARLTPRTIPCASVSTQASGMTSKSRCQFSRSAVANRRRRSDSSSPRASSSSRISHLLRHSAIIRLAKASSW